MTDSNSITRTALRQQKKQNAEQALAAPRLTAKAALNEAHRFLCQWTRPKDPEYFDLVAEVFQLYPAGIIKECMDLMRGIGRTPAPNGGPRIYPPEVPEIIDWCDARRAEYTLAVEQPTPIEESRGPKSAEDKARVAAKTKDCLGSLARALGGKTKEDMMAEAHCKLAIAAAQQSAAIEVSESLKRNVIDEGARRAWQENPLSWLDVDLD
jgi:hypothetical protein